MLKNNLFFRNSPLPKIVTLSLGPKKCDFFEKCDYFECDYYECEQYNIQMQMRELKKRIVFSVPKLGNVSLLIKEIFGSLLIAHNLLIKICKYFEDL